MCGIVGVIGDPFAGVICLEGARGLNHRGQDGAGIAFADSKNRNSLLVKKGVGLVRDVFAQEGFKKELFGDISIGHVRYATTGEITEKSCHPFAIGSNFALAVNGNLVPSEISRLNGLLKSHQHKIQSDSDSELMALFIHQYLKEGHSVSAVITEVMRTFVGAFSAVMIYNDQMIAFRDPLGIRPLHFGKYIKNDRANDHTWFVASETVAFDRVRATPARAVKPGEMIVFRADESEPEYHQLVSGVRPKRCLFEDFYFSRPDSVDGYCIGHCREMCGNMMAEHHPASVQIVVPVPDSGIMFAEGFAFGLGVSLRHGFIRSHDVGRTFIDGRTQDESVRHKYNLMRYILDQKAIALCDDSLVRGKTTTSLARMLKDSGNVREIHLRLSFPEVVSECYYGIHIATKGELVANRVPDIRVRADLLGVNSLAYPSVEEIHEVLSGLGCSIANYCTACCTGEYPTKL
jgi:amidophosphoribosyltransferase